MHIPGGFGKFHLSGYSLNGGNIRGKVGVVDGQKVFEYETRVKLFGESHEVKINTGNLKFHLKMERTGWKIDTFA